MEQQYELIFAVGLAPRGEESEPSVLNKGPVARALSRIDVRAM